MAKNVRTTRAIRIYNDHTDLVKKVEKVCHCTVVFHIRGRKSQVLIEEFPADTSLKCDKIAKIVQEEKNMISGHFLAEDYWISNFG